MGFSRVIIAGHGCAAPARLRANGKTLKKLQFLSFFKKKWSWRSSFEVPRFSFRRMLQLIWSFCFENPAKSSLARLPPKRSQGSPQGSLLGSPWPPLTAPNASKIKQRQAKTIKCKQKQANAGKSKQMQAKVEKCGKSKLAKARKCKHMHAKASKCMQANACINKKMHAKASKASNSK